MALIRIPAIQVESLRAAADEEFRRRCALERALRDAASAFKRELFEKGEELASLLVCFQRLATRLNCHKTTTAVYKHCLDGCKLQYQLNVSNSNYTAVMLVF